MDKVCLISNYDSGCWWSVYVEGSFICRKDKEHTDYSFWWSIVNNMCAFNLDDRIAIYEKYNIDIIIVCEDGDIEIYNKESEV